MLVLRTAIVVATAGLALSLVLIGGERRGQAESPGVPGDLPAMTATLITCLPDDTSVTVTEVESSEVPGFVGVGGYMITLSPFGGAWAHVRTDAGQEGWVSSEFLDWAD